MSFRDTFTRNSNSSENLQYDDNAAYHFLTTLLLLGVVPLLYNIIKSFLNPFGHIPKLRQIENKPQFAKKISKFKKQNRYKFLTCWFFIKIVLAILFVFGLFQCYFVLSEKGDSMKGFDPYEILQVDPDTPIQKIKKSYRKLALKYHPDRNQDDPEANARFIMISKAYECLTDEKAKQNCLKFGNPQGTSSFNVGIALPSFLVKKQNQVFIMGIVFVFVVIILPIFLIYYFGQINKFDEYGMLQESHPFVHSIINQQLSIKDCVKCLAVCAQFKNLKVTKAQVEKLEILLKQSQQDYAKLFLKKGFPNYIKKSIVLIGARINEKKVPEQLMDDYKFILKTVPVLIKSIIQMSNERSNELIARFRPQAFVGANGISSLIMFAQYFIQGRHVQSEAFQQLDLTPDQVDKIYKKKKKRNLNLAQLHKNQEERSFILSTLGSAQRVKYIEDMISYIPKIQEFQVITTTAGDRQITTMDNIEFIINLKSNRKGNFCNAIKYPFLKMEGWWVLVSDRNYVAHLEYFNFDKSEKAQIKFYRGYREAGNFSLTVKIFSDCYFGLDVQRTVKFVVKQKKPQVENESKDDLEQQKDQSLITKLMKSMMPEQEEELSDQQDNEKTQKKKKQKKQEALKQEKNQVQKIE